jgi:hypothetical protein
MNDKQNIVFFLGLTLLIMVFWVNGYWSILNQGIFKGPSTGSSSGSGKGKTTKCPPGYILSGGQCLQEEG